MTDGWGLSLPGNVFFNTMAHIPNTNKVGQKTKRQYINNIIIYLPQLFTKGSTHASFPFNLCMEVPTLSHTLTTLHLEDLAREFCMISSFVSTDILTAILAVCLSSKIVWILGQKEGIQDFEAKAGSPSGRHLNWLKPLDWYPCG
jgi:hypothetical protein